MLQLFQTRSTLPTTKKILAIWKGGGGGGGEFLISKVVKINYCRMSEVGSVLASNFLHGGHVDVFWNDLAGFTVL
jgi:hypothetical protein